VPWSVEVPSAAGWTNAAEHVASCMNGMRDVLNKL